jgi:hypothetical protein
MIAVGGVLGGVLGTMHRHHDSTQSQTLPHSNSTDKGVSISNRTQLATANAGTAFGFHIVLFQDGNGGITAIESRGSGRDVYSLASRFDKEDYPTPLEGSPFSLERFGSDGDLHLFYVDDALRLSHIVRRARKSGKGSWELGSLTAFDAHQELDDVNQDTLRLSVTTLPADWENLDGETLVIMYQTSGGSDVVQLLTSPNPDDEGTWSKQSFSLGSEALGLDLHPTSPGFLILPFERVIGDNDEAVVGIRLMWDLANDSHKTTFGIIDCTLTEEKSLNQCLQARRFWSGTSSPVVDTNHVVVGHSPLTEGILDTVAEDIILDAVKPLRIASLAGETHNDTEDMQQLVRVLDSEGIITELLWDTDAWIAHSTFSVDTASMPGGEAASFTASCSAEDGIMYGLSEGKLYEFARTGFWWAEGGEDTGWEFIGVLESVLGDNS